MPRTTAMAKAIKKYEKEKVDHITFRVPKGMKAELQEHASTRGMSLNKFLFIAAMERMVSEKEQDEKQCH